MEFWELAKIVWDAVGWELGRGKSEVLGWQKALASGLLPWTVNHCLSPCFCSNSWGFFIFSWQ